jgi:hypothetical protein
VSAVSQDMSVRAPSGSAPFVMARQGAPDRFMARSLQEPSNVTVVVLSSDQMAIPSHAAVSAQVARSRFLAEVYMLVRLPNIFLIWWSVKQCLTCARNV